MKTLIAILLLISTNLVIADAGTIYLRSDGGDATECDGSVNVAKNATKKCALNWYYKNVTYLPTSTDSIVIGQGTFNINIQPPDMWVPISSFVASPLQYLQALKSGRKVFFNDLSGVAWELQLRKY